jgi:hypothetical protein
MAPRVDTTDAEVKAVYRTWRAYLSARPDSIYDNPYWSDRDQERYHDFDLSRRWTYGYTVSGRPIHELYGVTPRVLSIEPRGSEYVIRTLWAAENPSETDHIYSLQRVYARREDGRWKLHNALPHVTEDWKHYTTESITYTYPPDFDFDTDRAEQAVAFADSLRRRFDVSEQEPIAYYVAPSYAEMARLVGLDYAWDGNDGLVYPKNRQVFSGNGSVADRHELVHAVLAPEDGQRHSFVEEGIATYLGGFGDQPAAAVIDDLAEKVSEDSDLTFERILAGRRVRARVYYAAGAVLCKMVEEEGGVEALKTLLRSASTEAQMRRTVAEVMGVAPDDIAAAWREHLYRYGDVAPR